MNHEPECLPETVAMPCPDGISGCAVYHSMQIRTKCICKEIHACEERVTAGWQIIADNNYRLGLQAAREAVVEAYNEDGFLSIGAFLHAINSTLPICKSVATVEGGMVRCVMEEGHEGDHDFAC